MNWNIEKTTARERMKICDAMYALFVELERAEMLLNTVIDEDFGSYVQQPITKERAEWTGAMLRIVSDIMNDVSLAYKLTVANTGDPRVGRYIEAAERVKTAIECDNAHDAAFRQERGLPEEIQKARVSERGRLRDIEDAEALQALSDLMQSHNVKAVAK